MFELSLIQKIIVAVPPVLLAVTLHEVAHGWAAKYFGDRTAEMLGRLSLNPIKHIDPVGTIAVPALMLATTGFMFGWAKPVPVAWDNLKRPKQDMAWVALAGPFANLIMMILWGILLKIGISMPPEMSYFSHPLVFMSAMGVYINCVLMVLNLLPLPPLDGSRVLMRLLPGPLAYKMARYEQYGLFVLMALLITGILGKILMPIVLWIVSVFVLFTGADIFTIINILFT